MRKSENRDIRIKGNRISGNQELALIRVDPSTALRTESAVRIRCLVEKTKPIFCWQKYRKCIWEKG
jgi:hypothetical protein